MRYLWEATISTNQNSTLHRWNVIGVIVKTPCGLLRAHISHYWDSRFERAVAACGGVQAHTGPISPSHTYSLCGLIRGHKINDILITELFKFSAIDLKQGQKLYLQALPAPRHISVASAVLQKGNKERYDFYMHRVNINQSEDVFHRHFAGNPASWRVGRWQQNDLLQAVGSIFDWMLCVINMQPQRWHYCMIYHVPFIYLFNHPYVSASKASFLISHLTSLLFAASRCDHFPILQFKQTFFSISFFEWVSQSFFPNM